LRELGYAPGKTIMIEERWATGEFGRLPSLAAELVASKVNVLVVAGAPAAQAAKSATRTVPIVMTNTADPVGIGLVTSLARPGGNITGLSDFNTAVVGKRLELLKETLPSVSRVALLSNPSNPTNPPQVQLARQAGTALGLTLVSLEARRDDDIDRVFSAIAAERCEALLVVGDPFLGSHLKRVVGLANRRRLPIFASHRSWTDAGALLSYGTNFAVLFHRAASYVDKILKGANPAELPIEQPTTFELIVNARAARTLGVAMPRTVIARADETIE
jgi:putative ABC transport system substrate-binding protein